MKVWTISEIRTIDGHKPYPKATNKCPRLSNTCEKNNKFVGDQQLENSVRYTIKETTNNSSNLVSVYYHIGFNLIEKLRTRQLKLKIKYR